MRTRTFGAVGLAAVAAVELGERGRWAVCQPLALKSMVLSIDADLGVAHGSLRRPATPIRSSTGVARLAREFRCGGGGR